MLFLKYGDIWIGPLGVGWLTTVGIFLFHQILLIIFPTLILYTSNSRTWKVLHKTRQKNRAQKSLSQEPPGSITTATQPADLRTFHRDRTSQTIVHFWSTSTFAFVISPPRNHLLPDWAWQKISTLVFRVVLVLLSQDSICHFTCVHCSKGPFGEIIYPYSSWIKSATNVLLSPFMGDYQMLGARLICNPGESQAKQAKHSSSHFYKINNILSPLLTKSPDQAWELGRFFCRPSSFSEEYMTCMTCWFDLNFSKKNDR